MNKRRRRARRMRTKVISFDIETRGHGVKGGEGFIGDMHVGDALFRDHYQQMLAYARAGGLTGFMVVSGGDLIHGDTHAQPQDTLPEGTSLQRQEPPLEYDQRLPVSNLPNVQGCTSAQAVSRRPGQPSQAQGAGTAVLPRQEERKP